MNNTAIHIRNMVQAVRSDLRRGNITYDEAQRLLRPTLAEMNTKGRVLAKQYGMRFKEITFASLMR